jgi:hypothetical protein
VTGLAADASKSGPGRLVARAWWESWEAGLAIAANTHAPSAYW